MRANRARPCMLLLLGSLAGVACEDGPEQVFRPNGGDPSAQNGFEADSPWSQEGDKGFDDFIDPVAGDHRALTHRSPPQERKCN